MVRKDRRKSPDVLDPALSAFGAMTIDDNGNPCLMGLTSLETQEYRLLEKIALHGDADNFLRYVELGDLHEAALIRLRKSSTTK